MKEEHGRVFGCVVWRKKQLPVNAVDHHRLRLHERSVEGGGNQVPIEKSGSGGCFRAGVDHGDAAAAEHRRRPLDSAPGCQPLGQSALDRDAPEVPAIRVVLIRREDDRAAVGRRRDVFDLEIARCQQFGVPLCS